jgi:hypothetical protein
MDETKRSAFVVVMVCVAASKSSTGSMMTALSVLGSATMYCHVPVAGWCMLSMVAGSDMVLITSL